MKPVDPRLLRLAPAARLGGALTGLLGLLRAVLTVAQGVLLARLLARGFAGAGVTPLQGTLIALVAVVVARGAAIWMQEVVSRRTCVAVKLALRERVLGRVADLGPTWLSHRRSGELATLLGTGIESLDGYFRLYLPQLVLSFLVPVAVLVVLGVSDWESGVVLAATLPLLPLFLALVGMHTKAQTARQWRELSRLGGHFLDVVMGLPTLKVFGRAQAQVEVLRGISDQHRRATVRTLRTAFLSSLVMELVATLAVAVLAVSVGFRLLAGDLSLQTALTVLLLAPEAFLPLRAVGTAFHAAQDGMSAAESAFAVLDEPVPGRGARSAVPPLLRIELSDVTVTRSGRTDPTLAHVELDVAQGQQVALVGASGSGKSTLLGVLLGLVPYEGSARVDGVELRDLDLEAWRRQVAWVPQDPHLFARSVADNIRLGAPDASRAAVVAAATAAQCDEFLEDLPEGLDTVLGEGGAGLSVGQQRRVALARAFLRDARLLLLDEPTAGLDSHSEALVATSLAQLCEGRTVVLATHRRTILTDRYRTVALDGGRLRPLAGAVASPMPSRA